MDPWAGVTRLAESAALAEVTAAAEDRPAFIRSRGGSNVTSEEFRARILERQQALDEAEAEKLEVLQTPWEDRAATLIERSWWQVGWLQQGVGFPNGKCLNDQHPTWRQLWEIVLNAISGRQEKVLKGNQGGPPDAPTVDESSPGH